MEIARQGRISLSVDTWKREAAKDAEYQAALSQWEADAAAARDRNEGIPQKPVRRVKDGPGDQGVTCVPMVLYAGAAPWNAPTSSREIVKPWNGEYGITLLYHLIDPQHLPDSVFSRCSTDVGIVLKAIKYQNDIAMLDHLCHTPAWKKLDVNASQFITTAMDLGSLG